MGENIDSNQLARAFLLSKTAAFFPDENTVKFMQRAMGTGNTAGYKPDSKKKSNKIST